MKVSSLFNLITDGSDLLDFFQKVDTPEQLVSRLERLKREAPDELLSCIIGLRTSVSTALDDTLEMSAVIDETDDEDLEIDRELEQLEGEETQNPAEPAPAQEPKNVVPAEK